MVFIARGRAHKVKETDQGSCQRQRETDIQFCARDERRELGCLRNSSEGYAAHKGDGNRVENQRDNDFVDIQFDLQGARDQPISAPASTPPPSAAMGKSVPGSARLFDRNVANPAPTIIWPACPMLNMPARKAMTADQPLRLGGVAY